MSVRATDEDELPLRERLRRKPRPVLLWAAVMALLVLVEIGAVVHFGFEILHVVLKSIPGGPGTSFAMDAIHATGRIPTLLSRDLIPNQGYWNGEQWVGTFMGVSPMASWLVRVIVTYAYGFAVVFWLWQGYQTYREHYRYADWTPRDDQIDRFSRHTWGKFGFAMVFAFLMMAIFAPTLGPTTFQQNINQPYSYSTKYWDSDVGEVQEIRIGQANLHSASQGNSQNVGPWTYDDYGRFHPFGTLTSGKDLFTFMMYGSRISLFIGLSSMAMAGVIAAALALGTAYYKGIADLIVVVTSDSVQALPVFMVVILFAVLFQGHWLAQIYNGAVLLVVVFGLIYWPYLWRSVRGPAFQVAEQEWVDAAKSYGQLPRRIMEKHMLPYIIGYLLVYGSMSLGGIIVLVAGLSYLGLGITPPTPEWGRAVNSGQNYVATASWHIALIPGLMITFVVTGLNAFGDGVRDAIDPQSEGATAEEAQAGGAA